MNKLIPILAMITAVVSGCNVAPYRWPDDGRRAPTIHAIDGTRLTVKQEFRYSPTLTSYVLPAGEYLPIRTDARGTFYQSPRGVLVLAMTGGFVADGGIYRYAGAEPKSPCLIYLKMPLSSGWTFVSLHSLWGLNLNEKIAGAPPLEFD